MVQPEKFSKKRALGQPYGHQDCTMRARRTFMIWPIRTLLRTFVLGAFGLTITPIVAAAQNYPNRPVTIVVGYSPAATSDLVARTIGERLNAAWGQPVIVDNRSGGGGNIAAGYVARAACDGHTLLVGNDAIMT